MTSCIFLVSRDGREYFFKDKLPNWVGDQYSVQLFTDTSSEIGSLAVSLEMMDELFKIQDEETTHLKERVKALTDVVESVIEVASIEDVDGIGEAKAKLAVIVNGCREALVNES